MKGMNIYMLVEKIILNEKNKNGIKFWLSMTKFRKLLKITHLINR